MKRITSVILAAIFALLGLAAFAESDEGYALAQTPILDTSDAMLNNLDLCMSFVDGARVRYGDSFSFLDVTGPRTAERGYRNAVNGRGAKVVGGGISHVATTLYLALKQLEPFAPVTEKHTFAKFTGGYVSDKEDAIAVDYPGDLDLRFRNNWDDLTIFMWRDDENMYCEIVSDAASEGDPDGFAGDPEFPEFGYAPLRASLNQRMATRTGPNTKYTEPGTYPQSTPIRVFYQTGGNGVMWGMVEFEYNGELMRLYTGMKRIDAGKVPRDSEDYRTAAMARAATPLYGPGDGYARQPDTIPSGAEIKVFFQENDYAMVDYEGKKQVVRGWVPLSSVD